MAAIRFRSDFDPEYGRCVEVAPGLRRVVAQNPSKYTAWGTGTYLVGSGEVAIVDPGPALDSHIEAVLAAVEGETVTHLLITHTHADHSPAAATIQAHTGAPTYGFGPHPRADSGSQRVGDAEDDGSSQDDGGAHDDGEEHSDLDFVPDVAVAHGQVLRGTGFEFECLHTPGHISNHVCYAERTRGLLFSGDHVMGWSTSVISPPAGRVSDYLASLRLLLERDDRLLLPTHGPPVDEPHPYIESLIAHREAREGELLAELAGGPRSIQELVAVIYAGVRPELHEPAGRSVHAHLIALVERGIVRPLDAGTDAVGGTDPGLRFALDDT
jgi:glyoxylase-like metal-dependent hydrolase (beta-lactamase superfamily II)